MTAKQLPTVLRITSSITNQDEVFLVHVDSIGSRPLDIKLIGTDGELVFAVSCKLRPPALDRPVLKGSLILNPNFHIYALITGRNFNFNKIF